MFPALSPGPSSAQRARRQSGRSVARSGADRQGRWRPGGGGRRAWGSVTAPRIRRGPAQRGHTRTPIANRGHRCGDTSDLSRHGGEVLRQRFKRVLSLPEPIWPVPSWALPDRAIPGMAVPGAVPTDGEGQLGWGGDGAGWRLVVAPGGLVPDPDFGALVPEPVVCAIAGPASSASTPAIARVSTIDVSWSWSWKASEGQRATSEWRPHDRLTASINTEPHEVSLRGAGCDAYVPSSRRVVPPKPGLMFLGIHTVDLPEGYGYDRRPAE
jgi:hypothetical protein